MCVQTTKKNYAWLLVFGIVVYFFNRDRTGKITRPAPFQSTLTSGTVARVEPNRKWFGMHNYINK